MSDHAIIHLSLELVELVDSHSRRSINFQIGRMRSLEKLPVIALVQLREVVLVTADTRPPLSTSIIVAVPKVVRVVVADAALNVGQFVSKSVE